MEETRAVIALTALGQATRLAIYRRLVQAGAPGRMAGELASDLGVPAATLSFHLKELSAAGLVHGEARGRYVCYRADFEAMNALVGFLTANCCTEGADPHCLPAPSCRPRAPRAR